MKCLSRCCRRVWLPLWPAAVALLAVAAKADETNAVLPVVSVVTTRNAAEFGSPTGAFTVQRTGDTNQALVVNYRVSGTATNGVDYQRLSGTVTLPPGQSSAEIEVIPVDNQIEEPAREVSVTLVPGNEPFTLVVLPDSQYYTHPYASRGGSSDMFTAQTQWIAEHKDQMNIAFVLHEGDLTDWNNAADWANARFSMSWLNGVVPYAMAVGNHDGLAWSQNQTTLFNAFFPQYQFQDLPTFGGVFESNRMDNCYHLFSAGGVDWLVMALEFGPRNEVLAWANQVVTNHPDRQVILVTHTHVYSDSTLHGSSPYHAWLPTSSGRQNNGTDVWDKFLSHHANVRFVFNGHVLNSGIGRLVGVGDQGNRVYQMLANYQMNLLGGAGYLRIVQLFPDQDRMSVRTYSPYLDTSLTDSGNQFDYANLGIFTNTSPGYLVDTQSAGASLIITNETVDLTPPGVSGFSCIGLPPAIKVLFDEPVEAASAQTVTNYSIDNGLHVVGATLQADGRTVVLTTDSDLVSGGTYTLTVSQVKDCSPATNEMVEPAGNTFTYTPVLASDDFADGVLQGWTVVDEGAYEAPSFWRERSGHLLQLSNLYGPSGNAYDHRKGTFLYWNDPSALSWSNYAFSVTFNSTDDDGVGLLFRYQNPSNYYKVELDSSKRFRRLFKMAGGVETTLATESSGYTIGSNYTLYVEVTNSECVVLLNGAVLFGRTITDSSLKTGTVGLYSWASAGVFFDNVRVSPLTSWPQAVIQSPTNGAVFTQPEPVPIAVEASDPDGQVKRVDLFWGTTLVASLTNAPYLFQWEELGPGNYTLIAQVVDDSDLTGISSPVSFVVIPPPASPAITAQPSSQIVYYGEDAVFRVRLAGGQPMHYQWLFDGDPIEGATNAFLILHHVEPGTTGSYSVVITNAWGIIVSQDAGLSLDWSPPPPGNTNDPPSLYLPGVEMFDPGGLLLSIRATNVNALNIEWSPDCLLWDRLLTLTNHGQIQYFADPDAVNQPMRFYRAIAQP